MTDAASLAAASAAAGACEPVAADSEGATGEGDIADIWPDTAGATAWGVLAPAEPLASPPCGEAGAGEAAATLATPAGLAVAPAPGVVVAPLVGPGGGGVVAWPAAWPATVALLVWAGNGAPLEGTGVPGCAPAGDGTAATGGGATVGGVT